MPSGEAPAGLVFDDAAHAFRQGDRSLHQQSTPQAQVLDFFEIGTARRVYRKAHACQNAVSFGSHNP